MLDQPQPRRIGLPVVDKVHKTMRFHAWYPGCPMEEDAYGIPKPKDTEVIAPTLLFVACVGYAAGGYRLGYGGGFYDRTLEKLRALKKVTAVGVAYHAQMADDVPVGPHDAPLDYVMTEQETFACG